MSMNEVVKKLSQAIDKQADKAKTTAYDTPATVRRIEGDTAWVHIPGGVDETPVKLTISAKEGDQVQVRVSGGSAFMVGNGTNPPTDDARANEAYTVATVAEGAAENALANASRAKEAADSAQASASAAESAAGDAVIAAGNAQTAAGTAQTAADSALVSLATAQDVVGVLNWITAHGTMTLTSDVAVNPAHVYFVVDPAGDYVVGGTHYSIVSEPKDAELSTYYELTVDESVQNYVATHIVVDSEGLWIVPDAGGNKVLIATGAGSTYTTAGTYIVGSDSTVLASFTANRAVVGNGNAERIEMSPDGLSAYNTDSVQFFDVDYDGGTTTETRSSTINAGGSQKVYLTTTPRKVLGVERDLSPLTGTTIERKAVINIRTDRIDYDFEECTLSGSSAYQITKSKKNEIQITASLPSITPGTSPTTSTSANVSITTSNNKTITLSLIETYTPSSGKVAFVINGKATATLWLTRLSLTWTFSWDIQTTAPAFTLGTDGGSTKGSFSVRAGQSLAAESDNQTAIGKYNDNDSGNAFEIGNGTADNARSNALTVDWSGNVMAQGMAGVIQMFAGSTAPTGWLICDGSAVSRTTYATLFAVIGTTYGTGDGSTTFNLPDLRGRVAVGAGTGTATDATAHALGQYDGAETVTLTESEIPAHTHGNKSLTGEAKPYTDVGLFSGQGNGTGIFSKGSSSLGAYRLQWQSNAGGSYSLKVNASHEHDSFGGSNAHDNMQPYLTINYIIATGKTS